jgi:aromatic-amino-acid transaminase
MWSDELDEIREHMKKTRATLAAARVNSIPMHLVANQKGMFTSLPLSEAQVVRLREEFGVYMTDAARINVAGLPANEVDRFIEALKAVA